MTGFSIGRLSAETGVNIETIRFYEKVTLMPKPPRTEGGRRLYGTDDTARLNFIRRARELGFSINDIRGLLGFNDHPPTCAEVHETASRHRAVIRNKIADLKRLDQRLSAIMGACTQAATPDCALIDALLAPRPQRTKGHRQVEIG
jgi:MerR family mercuric resistance operon transcriptional regulator